jgi:cytochrome c1
MRSRTLLAVWAAVAALALAACNSGSSTTQPRNPQIEPAHPPTTGGSPQRGKAVIGEFRCGKCHMIPGISGADGLVGPPLIHLARRTYLAGEVPNVPQNLMHWIEMPTALKPKTYMPDLGLTAQQAKDVAAYLETLH